VLQQIQLTPGCLARSLHAGHREWQHRTSSARYGHRLPTFFTIGRSRQADIVHLVELSQSLRRRGQAPEKSSLREADCRTVGRAEPLITWRRPKSEPQGWNEPVAISPGRRGRHVKKDGQRKRGTTRRSPRRNVHSEGISYKPLSGENGRCLRVGRMGSVSDDGAGQKNPRRGEGPWGRAADAVRTESCSSTIGHINLDRKQTGKPSARNGHARFEAAGAENQLTIRLVRHSQRKRGATDRSNLKSLASVLDPTFREGNGNVGITRSPLSAIALPEPIKMPRSNRGQCHMPVTASTRQEFCKQS
jgi:hypothetical protein